MSTQVSDWTKRAEKFAKIRTQIKELLKRAAHSMDAAEIANQFKEDYRYLPNIERRLRELVASGEVAKIPGDVPRYDLTDAGWLSLH